MVSEPYVHDIAAAIKPLKQFNWSANIFRTKGIEVIDEVSFHTLYHNMSYEVYVNKFGKILPPYGPETPQGAALASGKEPYCELQRMSVKLNLGKANYP